MRFYQLPPAVEAAMINKKVFPYVRIAFEKSEGTQFIPNEDILSCEISSYKENAGGIVNKGTVVLDNAAGRYESANDAELSAGLCVQIWYCFGDNMTTYLRHTLYVGRNGFENEKTGPNNATCTIQLVDLSENLRNVNTQRDWTEKQVVVHCVVCDKEHPDKSLVHIIAARAKLSVNDIDCAYLPYEIPYVVIERSVWDELTELAAAYQVNLECGKDKPLSFTESPFDPVNAYSDEPDFTLTADDITHYRGFENNENYANCVRLKFTHYIQTPKTQLWKYSDGSCWYDENIRPYYPFTDDEREICRDGYEAVYTAMDESGKNRRVVYAEDIDDEQTFKDGITVYGEEKFIIEKYDTMTYRDHAVIKLNRDGKNILLGNCSINGSAIVGDTNCCIYLRDDDSIERHGLLVKNMTNKFLSDTKYNGEMQYKQWASNVLEDSKKLKEGFFVKTNMALIHARAGACMNINLEESNSSKGKKVLIEQMTLRYQRTSAFETTIWLITA